VPNQRVAAGFNGSYTHSPHAIVVSRCLQRFKLFPKHVAYAVF